MTKLYHVSNSIATNRFVYIVVLPRERETTGLRVLNLRICPQGATVVLNLSLIPLFMHKLYYKSIQNRNADTKIKTNCNRKTNA